MQTKGFPQDQDSTLPKQGGQDSIPGQRARSYTLQLQILPAATRTPHSQRNKYNNISKINKM